MRLTKRQLKRIIREEYSRLKRRGLVKESMSPSDPNYELVGDVIEACKQECVDNNITHPDDIYEFCFELAREHGVEDKADYIAQLVHGWVAYVLN